MWWLGLACVAGVPEGCTALGYVRLLGVEGFASPRRAEALFRTACEAGEATACTALGRLTGERRWLERGDPSALVDLGRVEEACEQGVAAACRPFPERLPWACEAGDVESCVLAAVLAGEPVDGWCPESDRACAEAEWPEAEPVLAYGTLPDDIVHRGLFDVRLDLHDCLRDALERDPSAGGPLRAVWRVDPDGSVAGAWVPGALDEAHGACVAEVLRGARFRPPEAPALLDRELGAWHGAEVAVRTEDAAMGDEEARVEADVPVWSAPLDACFLAHDRPDAGVEMEVSFRVNGRGRLRAVRVERTSETPEVDACVRDFLSTHRVATPPKLATPMMATITFLEPAGAPERSEGSGLAWTDGPVTTARVLVLTSDPPRRLEEAYNALADRIASESGGFLRLRPEIREIEAGSGPEAAIEPSRWDLVLVHVPEGAPAQTWSSTLRGATVSMVAVDADPYVAVREQLALRAERMEGVTLAPSLGAHHPTLWQALLAPVGERWVGDLGATALAGGVGVANPDALNDGLLTLPGFDTASRPRRSAGEDLWFELAWSAPVELRKVRARMEAPGPVAVEVVGLDDQPVEVARGEVADGELQVSFAPVRAVALRLRPVDWLDHDGEPIVYEIDVF